MAKAKVHTVVEDREEPIAPKVGSPFTLTGAARSLKFVRYMTPVALKYVRMRGTAKKVRMRLKKADSEAYYAEKNALWDGVHEESAEGVRRLFMKMGGVYNKLAQDWATRDGFLPKPWCVALQGSFESFEPQPWSQIEKVLVNGLAQSPAALKLSKADRRKRGTALYFREVNPTALAAASIGQVHLATLHTGEGVVVKIIYPDIRKNLYSDLANARFMGKNIVAALDIPMKETVDVIMNEFCENFPKELDFRNEAYFLKKARDIIQRRGLKIVAPMPYEDLCSERVLTQELFHGRTLASIIARDPEDLVERRKCFEAAKTVAAAIGEMMFADKFFHADPHPGNIMVLDDGRVGLIDFGQCVELRDAPLREICQLVVLMRTRNKHIITEGMRLNKDLTFNTEDPELQLALLHFFFDTSASGNGIVKQSALDVLEDMIQHNPKKLPVLTKVPSELIFFGRVCTTLRKAFLYGGEDFSVVEMWYPHARAALERLNEQAPDSVSTLCLLMPADPTGLLQAISFAQSRSQQIAHLVGRAALLVGHVGVGGTGAASAARFAARAAAAAGPAAVVAARLAEAGFAVAAAVAHNAGVAALAAARKFDALLKSKKPLADWQATLAFNVFAAAAAAAAALATFGAILTSTFIVFSAQCAVALRRGARDTLAQRGATPEYEDVGKR
ncbi:hypothetical protein M885DRAFT_540279 [Pelagophyceae sp. CCMP2097]|nr:hypothetical protein M885DRAFT_540279 [Pelagophyceae sp. CCMP2097]